VNNKLLFYKGFRLYPISVWPFILNVFEFTFNNMQALHSSEIWLHFRGKGSVWECWM